MVERLFGGEFIFRIERMEHVCKLTRKSWERGRPETEESQVVTVPGFEAAGDRGQRAPAPGEGGLGRAAGGGRLTKVEATGCQHVSVPRGTFRVIDSLRGDSGQSHE